MRPIWIQVGDRGGSEEPTQAYLGVRRGERRSDNEGIHLKANRPDVMKVAVVNCGSSSIKYEVFGMPEFVMLASGLIEKIGSGEARLRQRRRNDDSTFDEQVISKRLAD